MAGGPLFKINSSGRLLRRRQLCGCSVSPQLEAVDLIFRVLDRGFGIGPGKAHLDRGNQSPVDHDGFLVGAANPGVPQTSTSLERFNRKAVMVHLANPPGTSAVEGNMRLLKGM